MKKTLVAVAALAAVTGAMAQATISGSIEYGVFSTTTNTAGVSATTKTAGDAHANSSLNFSVTEDLGDGLTASGQIGMLPVIDAGTGINGYQSFLNISGPFGSIQGGRFADSQALVAFSYDAMGAWGGSAANFAAANWGGFFKTNQIKYTAPSLISGLSASYTKGLGETTGTRAGESNTFAVGYAAGGFSTNYATTTQQTTLTNIQKFSNLGVAYDFGAAKVQAMFASQTNGTNAAVTGSSYAVVVPMGAMSFAAQTSSASAGLLSTNTGAATAVKNSSMDYKVSYTLSKRTALHGMYGTRSGYNGTSFVSGDSTRTTQLFVLHSF